MLTFAKKFDRIMDMKNVLIVVLMLGLVFLMASVLFANEAIDIERLATAIHKAEGNDNYGILKKIKGTNYRKACIQTINHALRDWSGRGDFIAFLGNRYAPVIGATNDPKGLNRNWVKNVKWFYAHN